MDKKMIKRILFSVLTILLLVGLGSYFYSLLNKKPSHTPDSLLHLVPQDVVAIWETEDLYDFVSKLKKPSYYALYDSLNISDLLIFLLNNMEEISDEEGHHSNPYLKDILVSFHAPNTSKDQVLYLKPEETNRNRLERLIRKLSLRDFSPKSISYRNENIVVYPFPNNNFIACYYNPSFLVISYQERLIEQVIDSYLDDNSILSDSIFSLALENKKGHSESTLYLRTSPLVFQKDKKITYEKELPAQWVEFDIITNRDAIYLAGNSFFADSMETFSSSLQIQEPVKVLSSDLLPESTFLFSQLAVSDLEKIVSQINTKPYPPESCSSFTEKADSSMFVFLHENGGNSISNFTFDTPGHEPYSTIIHLPLKDRKNAENRFHQLQLNWYKEQRNNRYIYPIYHFGKNRYYSIYELPEIPFLHAFAGIPVAEIDKYYGCFYQNELLISPYYNSLTCYIDCIEKGATKENDLIYQECMAGLAPESNAVLLTDLGEVVPYREAFNHVIPDIFFTNPEFFKHFILVVQYTLNQERLSSTISLIYKGEEV